MMNHKVIYTSDYLQSYEIEFRYSVKYFGGSHTTKYFARVDDMINNLQHQPKLYRDHGQYRIANGVDGIYVLYNVDDTLQSVTILDIAGNKRIHTIKEKHT